MRFDQRHLLGIEPLRPDEITTLLDLSDRYVALNRQHQKQSSVLAGLTQINMFFENSTRTQASFELAGKRLGADVMNMAMQASSIKKGETLIDTARRHFEAPPAIRFTHADALDWVRTAEAPERFTKVICYAAMQYFPDDMVVAALDALATRFDRVEILRDTEAPLVEATRTVLKNLKPA